MAPRFNVENMPPTRVPLAPVSRSTRKLKSSHSNPFISSIKVKHNGIHAARRRSRPVRPTCPKQTPVSHTQCIDVEMRDGSQSAGAGPSTHHVKLPRTLIRPDFNAISRDAIEAVACHLADVPVGGEDPPALVIGLLFTRSPSPRPRLCSIAYPVLSMFSLSSRL
ncbi:hypothetical protein CONPUDRAFT_166410 [Coniophora puteana RWD-64-598 SS2]|uniref:Uncharacterized protein n=1 Tax=Coniophora puteana (strain RWD-64-598) TaxID=741705 RepID=A0A5M3MM70_CONPW|nr:uncharacterized protein CONPUDRAFT_166410 [Coniophora puteana RWD-64-598 SS2]EIW79681.1 hypothetical protein CONPUDRAFT_166410 [Coniophora puteana RWD-64-598 SS2]